MEPFPQRLRVLLADRRLHEFLWYCVPGVLVAFALRAWLMISMPYGYYHPDTHDFLTTPYLLKAHHQWRIHGKTTFLTPLLYTLAFFPKAHALIVIPLAQHARGLLLVLGVGLLARWWLVRWRWFIIPITVLAGAQPSMIFWEHTLVSESGFVFCAVMLAVAGTFFVRQPGGLSYGCLLGAMACVAAARPEGNLWQGLGIALVILVYAPQWKTQWTKIAGVFVLAIGMLSITKTSHSGLLLYSSLVHLTPDDPKALPGFGPYIVPLRDRMLAERRDKVTDDVMLASQPVSAALLAYAKDHPHARLGLAVSKSRQKNLLKHAAGTDVPDYDLRYANNTSDLCRRLAIESALAHPGALPALAWHKFLVPIDEGSADIFEDPPFHARQAFTMAGKPSIVKALGQGLAGTRLDTMATARAFVDEHYRLDRVQWFNQWTACWQGAVNYLHLPDLRYSASCLIPGLPFYFLLAMVGVAAGGIFPTPARRFHWAFLPVAAATLFIVTLAAAVIPRHRFVWEPFWILYLFVLLDCVVAGADHIGGNRRGIRSTL